MGKNYRRTQKVGQKIKALKAAFPHTIPVMTGYLFLGTVYGILMNSSGYNFRWPILMSGVIYAGSMQFVAINLLNSPFNPLNAFLMTVMVNARHLFYGLSMLQKFEDSGNKKPFLIFGLTDETFSILCSTEPPDNVDKQWFMLFITLLDYIYWIAGSAIGGILGSFLSINIKGIDFAMTALFVVVFINQWNSQKNHIPAIVGIGASVVCLLLFGPGSFIIPSMILITAALTLLRKPIERRAE